MEAPLPEHPGAKRARMTPVGGDFDITALPDTAIHRIFDFLHPRAPCTVRPIDRGAYTSTRVILSQTCRRLNFYFRLQYVKKCSTMLEFANAGQFLA